MLICEKELTKGAYLARTSLTPSKLSNVRPLSHGSNDDERRVKGRSEAYDKYNQTNSCCDSQKRWLVSHSYFIRHRLVATGSTDQSTLPNSQNDY
jgi:hypothetical protein